MLASQAFGLSLVGSSVYFNFTDSTGRSTRYGFTDGKVTGIKHPGFSSDDVTVAYDGSGKVASVTDKGVTTSYAYADLSGVRTTTVTNALSQATIYTFDIATSQMKTMKDAQNHQTAWAYDASGRVTRITHPEGNYVNYTYDARGNVTETRVVAKSGSGLADIVRTASFDATCSNAKTCNQPNAITDARGAVTSYTYDATHGGVTLVTAPAPVAGARQPQTRYSYTALQAFFDRGGGIVASGEPVYQLTGISSCQVTASCGGTADQSDDATVAYTDNGQQASATDAGGNQTTYEYDGFDRLLKTRYPVATAGSGTSSTTDYEQLGYDANGNVTSRRLRDGQSIAYTYDALNRLTLKDLPSAEADISYGYDLLGRPTSIGSSAQTLSFTYDALGRNLTQVGPNGTVSSQYDLGGGGASG